MPPLCATHLCTVCKTKEKHVVVMENVCSRHTNCKGLTKWHALASHTSKCQWQRPQTVSCKCLQASTSNLNDMVVFKDAKSVECMSGSLFRTPIWPYSGKRCWERTAAQGEFTCAECAEKRQVAKFTSRNQGTRMRESALDLRMLAQWEGYRRVLYFRASRLLAPCLGRYPLLPLCSSRTFM